MPVNPRLVFGLYLLVLQLQWKLLYLCVQNWPPMKACHLYVCNVSCHHPPVRDPVHTDKIFHHIFIDAIDNSGQFQLRQMLVIEWQFGGRLLEICIGYSPVFSLLSSFPNLLWFHTSNFCKSLFHQSIITFKQPSCMVLMIARMLSFRLHISCVCNQEFVLRYNNFFQTSQVLHSSVGIINTNSAGLI